MTALPSERVVVQAPMSFTGSAARLWKLRHMSAWLAPVALVLIPLAWLVVAAWYVLFGVLLVPYRLVRRGSRKRRAERLRHRELLQEASRPDLSSR